MHIICIMNDRMFACKIWYSFIYNINTEYRIGMAAVNKLIEQTR